MARPAFHFTARSGWINDPHGITWRDGGYDVFYQYVAGGTAWSLDCAWGHARGASLLDLVELPPAILPGDGDDGVWTGCLVVDDQDVARAFYTSVAQPDLGSARVRVATARSADWGAWDKGPIVAEVPEGVEVSTFRDPFVLRDPDCWRMFVGAALAGGSAAALAYRSTDLERWDYEGIALRRSREDRDPVWTGPMWECPQIFEIDGRHVMLASVWDDDVLHYAAYALGSYADGIFTPDTWGRLTYGPSYYAPSLFTDAAGRKCVTFWMRGVEDLDAGWAGAHSVPHVLTIDGDTLVASPHPDVAALRGTLATDGRVDGAAAEFLWSPGPEDVLVIDGIGVTLTLRDGAICVEAGADRWDLPHEGGDVRCIVDGPTLEVSSRSGVFGLAVQPDGGALVGIVRTGSVQVRPLGVKGTGHD